MRLPTAVTALVALVFLPLLATANTSGPPAPPTTDPECTVTSTASENFYDLRPLRRLVAQTPPHHDWVVKGQDYGANFTLNICSPVLADDARARAQGLTEAAKMNVSAYYEKNGSVYSIGSVSTKPRTRGRKLVLAYEDGSPCPGAPEYRKSTLMSLMCDHEAFHKPSVAFVGSLNDCAYFFEVRTSAACATINREQALGPVAVFGVIMGVAATVYLIGGCVYQRTVMHARGWRQMPHYGTWAAVVGFVWVCLRFFPMFLLRLVGVRGIQKQSIGSGSSSDDDHNEGVLGSRWKRGQDWA